MNLKPISKFEIHIILKIIFKKILIFKFIYKNIYKTNDINIIIINKNI